MWHVLFRSGLRNWPWQARDSTPCAYDDAVHRHCGRWCSLWLADPHAPGRPCPASSNDGDALTELRLFDDQVPALSADLIVELPNPKHSFLSFGTLACVRGAQIRV